MPEKVSKVTQNPIRPLRPFTREDGKLLRIYNRARAEKAKKDGYILTPETKEKIDNIFPKFFKSATKQYQELLDSGLEGEQLFLGLQYYEKKEFGTDYLERALVGKTKILPIGASSEMQEKFLDLMNKEYGFIEKPAN